MTAERVGGAILTFHSFLLSVCSSVNKHVTRSPIIKLFCFAKVELSVFWTRYEGQTAKLKKFVFHGGTTTHQPLSELTLGVLNNQLRGKNQAYPLI